MPAQRRLADRAETLQVQLMVTAIGNHVFAGQAPPIIGAVLAELMSTFLLNHRIPSDLKRQAALREEMLTDWCATVRDLVAVQTDPPASETLQ
jgi:hypothetical protein